MMFALAQLLIGCSTSTTNDLRLNGREGCTSQVFEGSQFAGLDADTILVDGVGVVDFTTENYSGQVTLSIRLQASGPPYGIRWTCTDHPANTGYAGDFLVLPGAIDISSDDGYLNALSVTATELVLDTSGYPELADQIDANQTDHVFGWSDDHPLLVRFSIAQGSMYLEECYSVAAQSEAVCYRIFSDQSSMAPQPPH